MLETLVVRFRDVKPNQILKILQETDWDLSVAVTKVVMQRRNNLVDKLQNEFPGIPKEQIFYSIEANDNEFFDKTRGNLMLLVKERENSKPAELNPELEQSRIIEIVGIVKKDMNENGDKGIVSNFNDIFDNFARVETKLPGNITLTPVAGGVSQLENSLFLSQIGVVTQPQECPVVENANIEPLKEPSSKKIIKLSVPARVDFGESIEINWTHSGVPSAYDWVAMYAEGNSEKDYYTYQWVTPGPDRDPIKFIMPYSAASNFYFVYYSNRSYTACAESDVVQIGPKYNIQALSCKENSGDLSNLFTVTLNVTQEGGKEQPYLWIALYPKNETYIKRFVSYQYCSVNKEIVFLVPKSGAWTFQLFPFKSYESILSLPYFIEGEDKVKLEIKGRSFIISYEIKTLSLDQQQPWIGIYEATQEKVGQWKRQKFVDNFVGAMAIDGSSLPIGNYEARLLDYGTSSVFAKSEIITIN